MRASAILWGGAGLLLAACSAFESSPEQLCSADETYDSLLGIVVGQIQQSLSISGAPRQSAAMAKVQAVLGDVKEYVSFRVPTVSGFDEATKKTSCQAVMDFQVPTTALFAVPSGNLEINDARPDGVGITISYTIQPSADGDGYVYRLEGADELANVLSAAAANFAKSAATESGTSPRIDGAAKADDYEANSQIGCLDDWIYTAPDMDNTKDNPGGGFYIHMKPDFTYHTTYSDYGSDHGEFTEAADDPIVLSSGVDNAVQVLRDCSGQTATLTDGKETYEVRRFHGDPYAEFERFGWKPEDTSEIDE